MQTQVLQGAPGELTFDSRVELQGSPLAIGDVNGDGFADLVVGGPYSSSQVFVYFGNGAGSFTAGPVSPMQCELCAPGNSALADFNGDGKLDLVLTGDQEVFTMLGNGDGTFQPAVVYSDGGVSLFATAVAVGDLNDDGKPDFVVANTDGWYTFLNDGNGTFSFFSGSVASRPRF